jgi:hypothetical protein
LTNSRANRFNGKIHPAPDLKTSVNEVWLFGLAKRSVNRFAGSSASGAAYAGGRTVNSTVATHGGAFLDRNDRARIMVCGESLEHQRRGAPGR